MTGDGADVTHARSELEHELDALRRKYREERQKRLRPEGSFQYRLPEGELKRYLDDPFEQQIDRDPVVDEVEVAVIGGGFGGLVVGARLRDVGVENLRMVDQAGDFGGTWYWNRYPGAYCDTESYVYLPLLEETGFIPTERYATGPEIFEYCRRIARHYDLYRNALLETVVTELRWDDRSSRWTVSTNRGDHFRAKFVCMTSGAFARPKLPGIDGIETFTGHSFHTARWDYAYTGGGGNGNLVGLADKRVGIIGTGATGVSVIPKIGPNAEHLYVFQRTPAAVGERNNGPTDPAWAEAMRSQPGWHRERVENFSAYLDGEDAEEDLVKDGWTQIIREFRSLSEGQKGTDAETVMELVDFQRMEEIRARVDRIVRDKKVAEALKPYYRAMCKRPCFHDEYLDTFNLPNVTLVDTDGKGPDRITERGIVVNGVEYELDCIIFATGFQVMGSLKDKLGYEAFGRGSVALTEKWQAGVSTFFGMQTNGFPNLFIVSQSQVGISFNQTHPLDVQSRHIAYIVDAARSRGATAVEVTDEAEQWWVSRVLEDSQVDMEFLQSCTPSYFNNEGMPHEELFRRNGRYAPGITVFSRRLDEWRAAGDLWGQCFDGKPAVATEVATEVAGRSPVP